MDVDLYLVGEGLPDDAPSAVDLPVDVAVPNDAGELAQADALQSEVPEVLEPKSVAVPDAFKDTVPQPAEFADNIDRTKFGSLQDRYGDSYPNVSSYITGRPQW